MVKLVPSGKSKTKISLILVTVVAAFAIYSYFAYSREMFPFTKENKAKLNSIFKGKKPLDESALDEILGEESEGGMVDEFGSINNPRGGTGARGIGGAGSLSDPAVKGDLNMANLYQQELYRQLFLPFEDAPGEGEAIPGDTIIRGGDIPDSRTEHGLPQPYKYPFPVDDRLGDMYGLFPPGGSYGGRDPYSPIHGGNIGKKPIFNPAVLRCHDCPEGQSWDNCMCRCSPVDAPRLMCYRPDCECPGDDLGNDPDGIGGGRGHGRGRGGGRWGGHGGGIHGNGREPNCPSGYVFDSCRCKCVHPDTPPINCIRNCTECPQDQWYSFCSGQCVSGRQRQCEPELEFEEIPDIPEWLPDDAIAEIGDLRDLRDKLLEELDALQDELQGEIDELNDKIEEEKEKREELEDVVEEMKEEMEEEERDPPPPHEKEEHHRERIQVIAIAQAGHDGVKAEIKTLSNNIKVTNDQITATAGQAKAVSGKINAVASTGGGAKASSGGRRRSSGGGGSSSRSSSGSGTKATAGGGKAVACAGGKCISAGMALRVGYVGRAERQYAFSKLQHKARRMNTLKEKPTSFLKNKQFLNVLPPVVSKRHMASRIALS